jgi:RHS repeat-associated protein
MEMNAEDEADFTRLKKMLDRLGKAVIMSAEAETSEIIRRRLFEWYGLPDDANKTVAEYQYDGTGRLVEELTNFSGSAPGAVTYSFYDGQNAIETRTGAATSSPSSLSPQYQYVFSPMSGKTPILRDSTFGTGGSPTSAGRLYYTSDANTNVTGLVNAGGQVVERYVYSAYGNVTFCDAGWTPLTTGGTNTTTAPGTSSAVGDTTLYASMVLDPATGLFNDEARWYDASVSTFVSQDPAVADSNLYRYCGNEPLLLVDPSGMTAQAPVYGPITVDQAKKIVSDAMEAHPGALHVFFATAGKGAGGVQSSGSTRVIVAPDFGEAVTQLKNFHQHIAVLEILGHGHSDVGAPPAGEGMELGGNVGEERNKIEAGNAEKSTPSIAAAAGLNGTQSVNANYLGIANAAYVGRELEPLVCGVIVLLGCNSGNWKNYTQSAAYNLAISSHCTVIASGGWTRGNFVNGTVAVDAKDENKLTLWDVNKASEKTKYNSADNRFYEFGSS